MNTSTITVGTKLEINHNGRTVRGVVSEILPATKNLNMTPFVLKSARREYGCMRREDGATWIAC